MKTKIPISVLGLLSWLGSVTVALAQGTAFTYQGKLTEGGQPANGIHDFRFAVYDAASGGSAVAGPITNSAVGVTNGLFTTTLDFGPDVFTGDARWLEIGVRTNGAGLFTVLSPHQPLTPSPYALYAPNAGVALTAQSAAPGVISNLSLAAGSVTTEKIADGTISPADLSPAVASNTFWRLNGNAGTMPGTHFLGSTDNQPLELRVNNAPALRLEPRPTSPNVIGGFSGNWVAAGSDGAVIGGGGGPDFTNAISAHYGTISGGWENTIEPGAHSATIGGGTANRVLAGAAYATVGGGIANWIGTNAIGTTIAGGDGSKIGLRSSQATIAGGNDNDIEEDAPAAFVGGGEENTIQNRATHAVLAGGERNSIHAGAQHAVLVGGERNAIHATHAVLGGGERNTISSESHHAVLAGGRANTIGREAATVSGGTENAALGMYATVAGGSANTAGGRASTVSGGSYNVADGGTATIGGGEMNRAEGAFAIIAGGGHNNASGYSTAVGGGWENAASGLQATVAGGYMNTASGEFATVPGGWQNLAGGRSTFAAGQRAEARHDGADAVAGGLGTVRCASLFLSVPDCAPGGGPCELCSDGFDFTAVLTTNAPVQNGQLNTSMTSECGLFMICPGLQDERPRCYHAYRFINGESNACISVRLTGPVWGADQLFSAAYIENFDPNRLCSGFRGTAGKPGNAAYAFRIAARQRFVVVVS